MSSIILSIILLLASVGSFFMVIDPTYADIKKLRVENSEYDGALNNSKQIQEYRDKLLDQYNSLTKSDLERLEKVLPSGVDNVRLVMEIDRVAARYGMTLKNVNIDSERDKEEILAANTKIVGKENKPYGDIGISFNVSGTYESFNPFIKEIEESLRIIDIESISFSTQDRNSYQYEVKLRTYWLK